MSARVPAKKNLLIFLFLTALIITIYYLAFFNFFAQDDFILITHFSQNNFFQNLINVFGPPKVTHWRPVHNLYFLISGNLFGKNYVEYHALTFLFHIGVAFFIYKILMVLTKNQKVALAAASLYGVHPAHFVSLFWISGAATTIGFFFLTVSFYIYLTDKKWAAIFLFLMGLFASEAMLAGLAIFFVHQLLWSKEKIDRQFLKRITLISGVFLIVRLVLFTSKTTFDVYKVELSMRTFSALKYYLLRIAGFADISLNLILTIILLSWLFIILILLTKAMGRYQNAKILIFSTVAIIAGLFPFVLIPSHRSPHYMNISVWGFSTIAALGLKQLKLSLMKIMLLIFILTAFESVSLTTKDNWVIKRSNLAKTYLERIERGRPSSGSTLIFGDNDISSSYEAYVSLGAGEALNFWFGNKYKTCFSAFENCEGR